MAIVRFGQSGAVGVNKDLSTHELPNAAWTDAQNIRFLDGYAYQSYGYGEIYASPSVVPYHVLPININGARYLMMMGSGKVFVVNGSTYTDITRTSGGDYAGTKNGWTSTLLSGLPIINDTVDPPQQWDLVLANKTAVLTNWTVTNTCKSIRAYKNYLVALNVTKGSTKYPYMVKWSSAADPGTFPEWDETDPTLDAGETDLADGGDVIVDGLGLQKDFIIYKTNSMWRMSFVGGVYVMSFNPISKSSGILAKNCVVEMDGWHFVVTGSDIIVHDGQTITSVLDKQTRRYFFSSLDTDYYGQTFVFKNEYLNEICVAYPSAGSSSCNKMLVWNYKDKTVSFRDIPNLNHAASGLVESSLTTTWSADSAPWGSDTTVWNQPDFTPDASRVVWASSDQKLYLMDSSATNNGTIPSASLERIGLSFGSPETVKLVKGVRPRIQGDLGATVTISVGGANDPYETPTYTNMTHTIGSTVANDCLVSGRYIALKIASDTAYTWRLDSVDMDVDSGSVW